MWMNVRCSYVRAVMRQGRHVSMLAVLCRDKALALRDRAVLRGQMERGVEFLRKHAFDEEGRVWFALTREGQPCTQQRKPYGAVFVALAFVHAYSVLREERLLQDAVALYWKIRQWIGKPSLLGRPLDNGWGCQGESTAPGVWRGLGAGGGPTKLADFMVLALLALQFVDLEECGGERVWRPELELWLDGFKSHWKSGVLREVANFPRPELDVGPDSRLLNPGHSIEVCWFWVAVERRLRGPTAPPCTKAITCLLESLERGWDAEFGGITYFIVRAAGLLCSSFLQDMEGRPCTQLEAPMKLWWPHTEALLGVTLAYHDIQAFVRLTGHPLDAELGRCSSELERWAERVWSYIRDHFVDKERGGEWFGYLDR